MLYFDLVMQAQTKKSILSKINKINGCWEFTGSLNNGGYGVIGFKGKVWLAHRLSYYFHNGEIPKGLLVCHKCDNRKCINPDHLFLGTYMDNYNDMVAKGRWKPR